MCVTVPSQIFAGIRPSPGHPVLLYAPWRDLRLFRRCPLRLEELTEIQAANGIDSYLESSLPAESPDSRVFVRVDETINYCLL